MDDESTIGMRFSKEVEEIMESELTFAQKKASEDPEILSIILEWKRVKKMFFILKTKLDRQYTWSVDYVSDFDLFESIIKITERSNPERVALGIPNDSLLREFWSYDPSLDFAVDTQYENLEFFLRRELNSRQRCWFFDILKNIEEESTAAPQEPKRRSQNNNITVIPPLCTLCPPDRVKRPESFRDRSESTAGLKETFEDQYFFTPYGEEKRTCGGCKEIHICRVFFSRGKKENQPDACRFFCRNCSVVHRSVGFVPLLSGTKTGLHQADNQSSQLWFNQCDRIIMPPRRGEENLKQGQWAPGEYIRPAEPNPSKKQKRMG